MLKLSERICLQSPDRRILPLLNLLSGAMMTLAFAPYGQVWLVFPLLALLFYAWLVSTPAAAFWNGWLFGLGFQCTGISWIYNSLHYHGGSPTWLAVLMIVLLSAYLALYPALAGFLARRYCRTGTSLSLLLVFPMAWVLSEWLQGIIMTGFGWMQIGYSQIDWPLAGYAPVLGNLGVGLGITFSAGLLVLAVTRQLALPRLLLLVLMVWLAGFALKQVSWTQPAAEPVRVSLVQGNIPQNVKWSREMKGPTLKRYRDLSLQQQNTDLIIWPETAIPGYLHSMSSYVDGLSKSMAKKNIDLLSGVFIRDGEGGRYYNSLINVHGGEYRKRHLVPLGEYIPLRFLASFFNRWIDIPMSDIDTGEEKQVPLMAAGQVLGVSICFEDAFARDVIRDLPEATLLVNVSNDAWFEDSHEPAQHHAIARMRALESGRYMLRATNTGISAIIGPGGEELAVSPAFEVAVLNGQAQPMSGATPYVIWGDYLLLLLAAVSMAVCIYRQKPAA